MASDQWSEKMDLSFLEEDLNDLEQKGLKRRLRLVSGSQGREIILDGKKVLNFCSNNYLGLADDPRLRQAAIRAMEQEGLGSGASRLVCGNMSSHQQLEQELADFKESERCLLFSSGYMANVGILSGLFGRDDIIFSDKLNHASIVDGIVLSRAECRRYPHVDMAALEDGLRGAEAYRRRLIVTDSVFSMDGDCAPLQTIVDLAGRYQAMVMVDEAHAFGVLGASGKGLVEHLGLDGKIDIQMGTFSKAAGGYGAYCCGTRPLIEYLINHARSFIYTTGLPPSLAAAALEAVRIIRDEPERRTRLLENAVYVRNALRAMGFDTLSSETPIIPVVVKDAGLAVDFSRRLWECGIFVPAIRPPTVPVNTSRLRVTVMATHTRGDLDFLLEQFQTAGRSLCRL